MDYAKPARTDALAAEYVTGTMRGGARRRLESLLPSHPALRQAVHQWEARLMPLSAVVTPVEPPGRVWAGIQRRLAHSSTAAHMSAGVSITNGNPSMALPAWKRFSWWQNFVGFASVATLSLAVVLAVPRPVQPPVVVVLAPSAAAGEPLAAQARFVASVTADGRGLVLRPLEALTVGADRSLELWAVPATGVPRSLGLVDSAKGATVLRASLLNDVAAFAVSLEPVGGSKTGAPTGPVISAGKVDA